MQAHILSLSAPSSMELGQKIKTFFFLLKVVILHIKLKGMECSKYVNALLHHLRSIVDT